MEGVPFVLSLGFAVLLGASMWRIFEKAGLPGWTSLVPFYNTYLQLKIAGRPGWWMLLLLIPIVNLGILLAICLSMARRFGKSSSFGIGLAVLSIVYFPLLAFGDAEYEGDDWRMAA
jgi:hypothetical protein